jgi:hypothetical protein
MRIRWPDESQGWYNEDSHSISPHQILPYSLTLIEGFIPLCFGGSPERWMRRGAKGLGEVLRTCYSRSELVKATTNCPTPRPLTQRANREPT